MLVQLSLYLLVSSVFPAAQSPGTGSTAGAADSGAQIVVTAVEGGSVVGVMATCDGTYKVENLKPGRYEIVEGGPHHAVRKLSVAAGAVSAVDLGKATPESSSACKAK